MDVSLKKKFIFGFLWTVSVCVFRQVRGLREPPRQLGARRHRPQQRDCCHAGDHQNPRTNGQDGWVHANIMYNSNNTACCCLKITQMMPHNPQSVALSPSGERNWLCSLGGRSKLFPPCQSVSVTVTDCRCMRKRADRQHFKWCSYRNGCVYIQVANLGSSLCPEKENGGLGGRWSSAVGEPKNSVWSDLPNMPR